MSSAIRPPLLSDWESQRVQVFRNRKRRSHWLAGRALAKVLIKERLGLQGIIEIREGVDGEPLVFADGFPLSDVWLGISVRHGRVACVVADRPVSLEVRQVEPTAVELVDSFTTRGEQRTLRRLLGSVEAARSSSWAIKDAARRAARHRDAISMRDIRIDSSLGVQVGDSDLDVLAMRYTGGVAVAIVGRYLLEEPRTVRVVMDDVVSSTTPTRSTARLQAALERSMARARRITESRMRWERLRLDPS